MLGVAAAYSSVIYKRQCYKWPHFGQITQGQEAFLVDDEAVPALMSSGRPVQNLQADGNTALVTHSTLVPSTVSGSEFYQDRHKHGRICTPTTLV
jgi:hypothetical protein